VPQSDLEVPPLVTARCGLVWIFAFDLKVPSFLFLFSFFFFDDVKPENPYFASQTGRELKASGAYPVGLRSSSGGPAKGTPPFRSSRRRWDAFFSYILPPHS